MEISKADWKLYRERVSDWQEHYMEQLTKEYVELLTSPGNASDHFWELEKRIKQDKKHPGVLIELRKSTALWDIAYFVRDKVIMQITLNRNASSAIAERLFHFYRYEVPLV